MSLQPPLHSLDYWYYLLLIQDFVVELDCCLWLCKMIGPLQPSEVVQV
jgi:hypothetical protein